MGSECKCWSSRIAGGNGQGSEIDQLNFPADVIIDDIDCSCLTIHDDGTLYVSDSTKNRLSYVFPFSTTRNCRHQHNFYFHSYHIQTVHMATSEAKATCFLCNKTRETYFCQGCSKYFCIDHLLEHRTHIQQQFHQLQNDHDQLRQQINDFKDNPTEHPLIKQIDQWEEESIQKIKKQAQNCRTQWMSYSDTLLREMEKKLNHSAEQIQDIHRENQFNEIDLNDLKGRLQSLGRQLNQPTYIFKKQQITSLFNKISLPSPSGAGKSQ